MDNQACFIKYEESEKDHSQMKKNKYNKLKLKILNLRFKSLLINTRVYKHMQKLLQAKWQKNMAKNNNYKVMKCN